MYCTKAVLNGSQTPRVPVVKAYSKDIWLNGSPVYFRWPDAIPGAYSWKCWSRPGDNNRFERGFYQHHVEMADQDPASASL